MKKYTIDTELIDLKGKILNMQLKRPHVLGAIAEDLGRNHIWAAQDYGIMIAWLENIKSDADIQQLLLK